MRSCSLSRKSPSTVSPCRRIPIFARKTALRGHAFRAVAGLRALPAPVVESYGHCGNVYRKFRPAVVLGMGGFTSTAPLLAGWRQKLPTFIHESNVIPGRANKMAAKFVTKVLLGFKACEPNFAGRDTVVTGTPVRRNLGAPLPKEEALAAFKLEAGRPTLFVMGGSQGARASIRSSSSARCFSATRACRSFTSPVIATTCSRRSITSVKKFRITSRPSTTGWKRPTRRRTSLFPDRARRA